MASEVQEMVSLCRGLGLAVQFETGSTHYSVRDPDSNAKLFYISSTPSDVNFKYEIARHLRRLGLLKGNLKFGKFTQIKRKKKYGAIDLVALKKAQEAAESAGERIPLLEDLNDNTFLRQTVQNNINHGYVKEAQQEAIDNMPLHATPRSNATKQRLRKALAEKELSTRDFVKVAMEVGERRGLRVWPREIAGYQALHKFLNDDQSTMQIWAINLVEATLDHLEGLRFDTEPPQDEEARRVSTPMDSNTAEDAYNARQIKDIEDSSQFVTEESLGNILENFKVQIINDMQVHLQERVNEEANGGNILREKYADTLLDLLANNPTDQLGPIMDRLDKLVGL